MDELLMIEFLAAMAIFVIGMLVGVMICLLDKAADKRKKDLAATKATITEADDDLPMISERKDLVFRLNNIGPGFAKTLIRIAKCEVFQMSQEDFLCTEKCELSCNKCEISPCHYGSEDVELKFKKHSDWKE